MSATHAARHRIPNHSKSSPITNKTPIRNGYKIASVNHRYNNNYLSPQPHHQINNDNNKNLDHESIAKNGYLHSPSHERIYQESSSEEADTDTLEDMESQSPSHKYVASPQHLTSYPRTANNHAVRQRFRKPIKSLQEIQESESNNLTNRNTHHYYQRHWNKHHKHKEKEKQKAKGKKK
eukprot:263561_1